MNDILVKNIFKEIASEFKSVEFEAQEIPEEKKDLNNLSGLFLIYLNWRKRFISRKPRKVLYSKELMIKLSEKKEFKKIVNKIEYKIKNCEDLTPFLSKTIVHKIGMLEEKVDVSKKKMKMSKKKMKMLRKNKDFQDTLLNFFGIHHLHLENYLSKTATKGINFTCDKSGERNKSILHVKIDGDTVYLLEMNEHVLFDENVLKILKNNFVNLLDKYKNETLTDTKKINYSSVVEWAKKGIIYPCNIDDEDYTFNTTVAGTSFEDFFKGKKYLKEIEEKYLSINTSKNILINKINKTRKINEKINSLTIKIIIKNGLLFFADEISKIIFLVKDKEIDIVQGNDYLSLQSSSLDFNS